MDPRAALAAYDEQIRRHPTPDLPGGRVERDQGVVRCISGRDAWNGVTWSELGGTADVDAVIAAQIDRFAAVADVWEWKHHSYDRPPDLPDRLAAAGFVRRQDEALLVADLTEVTLDAPPPAGVELHAVVDQRGVDALVAVHEGVFAENHSALGRAVREALAHRPSPLAAVVAFDGDTPIAAGRVEFHAGTEFASLWGGGTVPEWRGRGVFRALVAHRAALAAARGFRYLQVDALPASRPILERLGFVELATTTPFEYVTPLR